MTTADTAIRRAFLSFPVRGLQSLEGVPADFSVRFALGNKAAWLLVGMQVGWRRVDVGLSAAATGVDAITQQTLATVDDRFEIEVLPWSLRVIRLDRSDQIYGHSQLFISKKMPCVPLRRGG